VRLFIYRLADLEKDLDVVVINTGDGTAWKLLKVVEDSTPISRRHRTFIQGERYYPGERITTDFVASTVNQVIIADHKHSPLTAYGKCHEQVTRRYPIT